VVPPLSARDIHHAALTAGFELAGFARAEALDHRPLLKWLRAKEHADMHWMARSVRDRLDPRRVLKGAQTVIALARRYATAQVDSSPRLPVARYARGRDYHNIHRSGMRRLRRSLIALDSDIETYACVDTGVAMERAWAERAGIGFIGKNGCLIHPQLGSWLSLSVMFIDRAVDVYDTPIERQCGTCSLCMTGCPTDAFPRPGFVDARRCLSYQTIENRDAIPEDLRRGLRLRVFGCDVCQEVCPFNRQQLGREASPKPGDPSTFRTIGQLSAAQLAALTPEAYAKLSSGSPLARPGFDGIRRNAALSLGASLKRDAVPLLEKLTQDPSPLVSEAARWALARLRAAGYQD